MNKDKKSDGKNTPISKKTGIMKFFTSQTESPETSGVKLFPIFSRTSAAKSTPVSVDIVLVEDDKRPCVSSESSRTDPNLCTKDGSINEAQPKSKKSASVKRKRNSCEESKTIRSQDDDQLTKSSEEITSLNLKRTKVLCSPDNCSASQLFPIFNTKSNTHSPKLDEFVSNKYNTTIDSGTSDDPSIKIAVTPKKRGRKPGSKMINGSVCQPNSATPSGELIKKKRGRPRKETPCSTGEKSFDSSSDVKALEGSSSTPLTEVIKKKRGRPRKETWVTEENNSGASSVKAETPKKRGRKPGSSLLKRLDENLAIPFEDLTGSPRKRQRVVPFCAGVDDNDDVSESDDASVLSVSLSSDESSTSGSNSKVSVAAALTNMIMKSHKKKKCKEPQRSSSEVEDDTPLSNIKKSLFIEENTVGPTTENPVSKVEVSEETNNSPDSNIGSSKNLKTPTPKATPKKTSESSSTPESISMKSCKKPAKKQVDIPGRRTSSRLKDSVSSLNDESSSSLDIAEICSIDSKVQDNKVNSVIKGSKYSKSNDLQKAKCIKSKELAEDVKLFPLFTKKQTVSVNNDSQTDNVSKNIIEKPKKNKKTEGSLSMEKKNETQEEAIEVELVSSESSLNSDTDLKLCDSNKSIPAMENNSGLTKIKEPISNRKPPSRSFENHLSFPLQTHFNATISTEKSVECEKLVIEDEKPETFVQIPSWRGIVGVTSIKSLKETSPMHTRKTPKKAVKMKEQVDCSLWTDIESDYDLKEGVSESTISELNLWLQMWKSKFTKHVKKSHKDKEDSSDSFSSDSDGSDEDENSNGIIIMGPPGSGKTSLVFSLAAKHGFKVLEVNASSCRSGRNVSHQLKEALESYHVENTKIPESGSAMFDSKQDLGENIRDNIQKASKKGLLNFLKSNEGGAKNNNSNQTKELAATKDKKSLKKEKKRSSSKKTDQSKERAKDSSCTISGQTIILFDDIDVVFEEDEGLWSTIRGFLKISKKPVIFTVSRNLELVRNNIDLDMQVLYLKPMIKEVAYEKLISQCKKYGRDDTNINIGNLLPCYSYDLRRSLLHAQFWSQSLPSQKTYSPNNLVKHLSINTFGSADFSAADLSSLISNSMCDDVSLALSKYHKLGYDILHCNLYPLFNVASALEMNLQWGAGIKTEVCTEENSNEDLSHKVRKTKTDTKLNLWQEACDLFESKRKSLQSGSSSSDLFVFADIIEDFSFSDFLKGMATEEMNWFSIPERVKKWNLGWPVCSDFNLVYNDFIPEMISMIQILSIQVAKGRPLKCKLDKVGKESLVLLHPLTTELDLKIENHLDCIASALPPNLLLNKTVLKMDYLGILKLICQKESLRQIASGKRSNRFLHYFDAISLLIDKYQIEQILDNFV